jgi:SH3 domain.
MKLTSALPGRVRRCRARFSYVPACDDELNLEVDDVIDILSEAEEGWWKGKLRDKVSVIYRNVILLHTGLHDLWTWLSTSVPETK